MYTGCGMVGSPVIPNERQCDEGPVHRTAFHLESILFQEQDCRGTKGVIRGWKCFLSQGKQVGLQWSKGQKCVWQQPKYLFLRFSNAASYLDKTRTVRGSFVQLGLLTRQITWEPGGFCPIRTSSNNLAVLETCTLLLERLP